MRPATLPVTLKDRLRNGEALLGSWLFLGSADAADLLGHCGFDALILDHEHSPGGLDTTLAQLRAIRAAGSSAALARAPAADTALMARLLDIGIDGILMANVRSAEEARRAADACRYPPQGRRGLHYTVSRAARWGLDADAHVARMQGQGPLLIAMIESVEGAAALEEIGAVDGIDALFVGPLDLTASLGEAGAYAGAPYRGLLADIERRAAAAGLVLGTATIPGESAAGCFARGYRFVTNASDVGLLRQAALTAAADR